MSKLLVIMRHGHAEMADEDFDRRLSARGRQAAAAVGKQLAALGVAPDLVLASSALRATITAEEVCRELSNTRLETRRNLYLASAEETLSSLQALDNSLQCVVLVGHNPGVSELSRLLFGRPIAFAPAEYVRETVDINSWEDLGS